MQELNDVILLKAYPLLFNAWRLVANIHSSSANTNYEIVFQYVDICNELRGMTDGKLWHLGSSYILFAIVISVEADRRCWPNQNGEFQFVFFRCIDVLSC